MADKKTAQKPTRSGRLSANLQILHSVLTTTLANGTRRVTFSRPTSRRVERWTRPAVHVETIHGRQAADDVLPSGHRTLPITSLSFT